MLLLFTFLLATATFCSASLRGSILYFLHKVISQKPLLLAEFLLFMLLITAFVKHNIDTLQDNAIDFLKVIATLMVFCLHVSLMTVPNYGDIFSNRYMFFLRTPAWGAVWIFFFISGFLAARGFVLQNYCLHKKSGVIRYYKQKLLTVYLPTVGFMLFATFFMFPSFFRDNPCVLLQMLTLRYNGHPEVHTTRAMWYIFTLCPLYLLAPLFAYMLENKRRSTLIAIALTVNAITLFYRYYAQTHGFDYHDFIYTPFWCNIDLFLSGMVSYYLFTKKASASSCNIAHNLTYNMGGGGAYAKHKAFFATVSY